MTEREPPTQLRTDDRVEGLERENRDLSRRLAEWQEHLARASRSPVAGAFRSLQFWRRARARIEALAAGRLSSARARRIIETGMFDAAAYRTIAGLPGASDRQAAAHYATIGERQGLRPSAAFDPAVYSGLYPDLAGTAMGLLVHYARFGKAEGRIPTFDLDSLVRKGKRPFDAAKKTCLVACHAASRTGAPILGWNLVRALGRDP